MRQTISGADCLNSDDDSAVPDGRHPALGTGCAEGVPLGGTFWPHSCCCTATCSGAHSAAGNRSSARRRTAMAAVTQLKTPTAAPKDLYDIGEVPPLGHVPAKMHAWAIRKERHGPPESAMQLEVLPTWVIGDDEVLVYVMAGGVNYNGVWAARGVPISPLDVHKNPFHIAGSDAAGVVWAVGAKVRRWKLGDEGILPLNQNQ